MPSNAMLIDSEDDFDFASDDGSDFDFDEENIPPSNKPKKVSNSKSKTNPVKKTTKKVAKKKKAQPEPVQSDDDDHDGSFDSDDYDMDQNDGKTVEQIYQKKTQLEHILLRPDTYSKYNVL